MNSVYTDDELNVGKILVLSRGHKFTINEIKKTTSAEKLRKFRFEPNGCANGFINVTLCRALRAIGIETNFDIDLYFVEGEGATSTLLRLKTDCVLRTLEVDSKGVKKLHNACVIKEQIDDVKHLLQKAKDAHNALSEVLTNYSKNNFIKDKENIFNLLTYGYAESELKEKQDEIEEMLKNKW